MTRLPNRNLLQDRCEQAIAHAIRDKNLVAILFLDLDGFKPINDAMGHAAGDEVLKVVAERLLACVRDADTVARYGGDEFVVVLDGLQQESQASRVAEEILSSIGDSITIDGQRCQVGVSIGISVFPGDGDDADKLLKNADAALYAVKHGGKNSMKFYSGL
ncbi:GGDEF domain-containing protein [Candidatus Reidiella endopervernicosa]|uniref:GGDEF domain-containing protein n=1 Tax=Candidatus Reidiella endopervernicosa TaxID=2738883 RepID=A0A6N0I0K9_9GAMM|nr:GGDEF domain-containing protein [Candidatus Reidiella endopervernicosa]QKQ28124.1 GGDEF domain-containing protein [Candidatus Reidiella endopervernicosa]